MKPAENLSGRTFGRLTVSSRAGVGISGHVKWRCKCECGNEAEVESRFLKHGSTRSCGCLYDESRVTNLKHGVCETPEYRAWISMKSRCLNPKNEFYADYGARGITVCNEWLSLERFISDMGIRPTEHHSIERLNNNGNYEPSNCKWATLGDQSNNKRSSVKINIQGEVKTVSQWCKIFGWNPKTIYSRIARKQKGWEGEIIKIGEL